MGERLPFPTADAAPATRNGGASRGHHHRWEQGWQKNGPSYRITREMQWPDDNLVTACFAHALPVLRDEARARRGKSSDRLGKDQERRIERVYGPRKVGEFGDAVDHLGRDFKWQSKATRLPPPLWLAAIDKPTYRPYLTKAIVAAMAHMTGLGGTRRPLVIRSFVHVGVPTRDWLFVVSMDWLRLYGNAWTDLTEPGYLVIPGRDFLEIHGLDGEQP